MGCGQKSFKLAWRCHQFLSAFLATSYLPRVSRQSLGHESCAQISWHLPYNWGKPCRPFVVNTTSMIIVFVGYQNVVCCLVWAVLSWSSNHSEGRSLYIGSFCPAMTSLSSDLNSNCQLSKPGDRRNFKTCWKFINNERPTGKKHTSVRWDDGEK